MNNKVLIIPDVHGRRFWKEAVNNFTGDTIIFLGDYLDPYPEEGISIEQAIENFAEILKFKETNTSSVKLLTGNHDCHYIYPDYPTSVRYCYEHAEQIRELFKSREYWFNFSYETLNTLFTHAGVTAGWADQVGLNLTKPIGPQLITAPKGHISAWRGGWDHFGDFMWADIYEHVNASEHIPIFQVFGHTRMLKPVFRDSFACLDCSKAFLMDENHEFTAV